jgi:hypothetical protein
MSGANINDPLFRRGLVRAALQLTTALIKVDALGAALRAAGYVWL